VTDCAGEVTCSSKRTVCLTYARKKLLAGHANAWVFTHLVRENPSPALKGIPLLALYHICSQMAIPFFYHNGSYFKSPAKPLIAYAMVSETDRENIINSCLYLKNKRPRQGAGLFETSVLGMVLNQCSLTVGGKARFMSQDGQNKKMPNGPGWSAAGKEYDGGANNSLKLTHLVC
jgi:hypothetical protein